VGCNPIAHASWAVAGWLIYYVFPGYGVVAATGVWRSWRSCRISVVVRVGLDGGACGNWGGGGDIGVFWWSSWIAWGGRGVCGCVT
jgi:hypothetical protein